MSNKPRSQIYTDVVKFLKTGSYTILQIAEHTNINWETAKNAVETLLAIKLISPEEKNGKTYYFVNESNLLSLNENTLLGIPISEPQRKLTLQLKKRIQERWKDRRAQLKTFQNKILVKVIKDAKIKDIPYGWYLFGECVVLHEELTEKSITKYDKEIDAAIKYYEDCQTTAELMRKTYRDEQNATYLARLTITNILMERFTENSIHDLRRELKNLLFSIKVNEETKPLLEYIDGFVSMTLRITTKLGPLQAEEIRPIILEAFNAVWEIIATYNLYTSLESNGFYSKPEIKKYYDLRMESLKQVATEYLNHLKDYVPPLDL